MSEKNKLFPDPPKPNPFPQCFTCHWAQRHRMDLRCHHGPPAVRLPYEQFSVWPLVPKEGEGPGGCSFHKPKAVESKDNKGK